MSKVPSASFTFLFSDLEGSTRLWESSPDAMKEALAWHDEVADRVVGDRGGAVFKHTGDGFCAVFDSAPIAVRAALAFQQELRARTWPEVGRLRARVALHAGPADRRGDDYHGRTLNRCARLMAAAHGGQVVCSEAVAGAAPAAQLAPIAFTDLGWHGFRDLDAAEHVFEVRAPDADETFPPLRSLSAGRNNLPVLRTSFIGRERAIESLSALLATTPLVSIVGPGGVGKTRLALAVAAQALATFADGVFMVELGTVTDEGLIGAAIAASVGMPLAEPRRGVPADTESVADVARYLQGQRVLLVVDNCEHLLAACARIVDRLVRACPRLTVLVTSRESLAIDGEQVWRIPSLGLPEVGAPTAMVAASEAVQLFVARARAAHPAFVLDDERAPVVAEICRRLDGIPLAIELAAARTRHLGPQQIRERLDERFRLLTGGARTSPARQRTLEATMDWSHDLLTPSERVVLRRLAVFCGDVTLAAGEAVVGDADLQASDVLDLIGSLVDKSLVDVVERGDVTRYRLLETVRQYASRKLNEAVELDVVRQRHLQWFASAADAVPVRPWSSLIGRSAIAFRDESEDHAAAEEYARRSGQPALADRILGRIWGYWVLTGRWEHARRLLATAVERNEIDAIDRLSMWLGLAVVDVVTGNFRAVETWCAPLTALATEVGESAILPVVLMRRAVASQVTGDGNPAQLLEEAIDRARAISDDFAAAEALSNLGDVIMVAGDLTRAGRLLDQALQLLGAPAPAAQGLRMTCLASHSVAAHLRGDHAIAVGTGEESVSWLERGQTHWGGFMATTYAIAGLALAGAGEWSRADARLAESLHSLHRMNHPLADADCLVAFAGAAWLRGDAWRASCLLGAARGIMGANGAWRHPTGGALYLHYVGRVRGTLTGEAAARARSEGLSMSRDEAITYALASLGGTESPDSA